MVLELYSGIFYNPYESNNSRTNSFECDIKAGHYTWVVFTSLAFAFGFPASLAALWEIIKASRSRLSPTPNDIFMLNLSIMDTLFLTTIPLGICNHFIFQFVIIEMIWNGFYTLSLSGRPLLMVCICLDCYVAVVHPIFYHQRKGLTPRIVMICFVWILTLVCGLAYAIVPELYLTAFPIIFFVAAVVIIVICDSFILHTLLNTDISRRSIHPQKQRAIETLVSSLLMAIISYLPPCVFTPIGIHVADNMEEMFCLITFPSTVTSTLGSAVMPLLSLYNMGKLNVLRSICSRAG